MPMDFMNIVDGVLMVAVYSGVTVAPNHFAKPASNEILGPIWLLKSRQKPGGIVLSAMPLKWAR